MSKKRTYEQRLTAYQQMMGTELGSVFFKLENEVVYLHQQWNNFSELFVTDELRIEILNEAANSFFYIVQNGLQENIIMSIARLTDPSKTGKFRNLTLLLLPQLISDEELKSDIKDELERSVLKSVEFARAWRRKIYAHRDYDIHMGRASLEEKNSYRNIKLALSSIRALMNKIVIHFENVQMAYQWDYMSGNSHSLLRVIQDGLNCRSYICELTRRGFEIPESLQKNRITFQKKILDL